LCFFPKKEIHVLAAKCEQLYMDPEIWKL
jgi:hypothetical protein